jgi:hypothetical protein
MNNSNNTYNSPIACHRYKTMMNNNLFLRILAVAAAFALDLYTPYVQKRASMTEKDGKSAAQKQRQSALEACLFVFVLQIFNVQVHSFSYLRPQKLPRRAYSCNMLPYSLYLWDGLSAVCKLLLRKSSD